jgi:hypothetical protein
MLYPDSDMDRFKPSKRIRSPIRPKNIRTIFTPSPKAHMHARFKKKRHTCTLHGPQTSDRRERVLYRPALMDGRRATTLSSRCDTGIRWEGSPTEMWSCGMGARRPRTRAAVARWKVTASVSSSALGADPAIWQDLAAMPGLTAGDCMEMRIAITQL